jgi:hypothetical protein
MRGKLLTFFLVLLMSSTIWFACTRDESPLRPSPPTAVEGDEGSRLYEWAIGPIEGITTVWHSAPEVISVPVGTRLLMACRGVPESDFLWANAHELRRNGETSIAEYRIVQAGSVQVQVIVSPQPTGKGKERQKQTVISPTHVCLVEGVDVSPAAVAVRGISALASDLALPIEASNAELREVFSTNPARLRKTGPAAYRTAVQRPFEIAVVAADPRLAGLIEIRVPGQRPQLSTRASISIERPGLYTVSAGPPAHSQDLQIQTYSVAITKERAGTIAEDRMQVFHARTEPRGYEDDVTWLACSRNGSVAPVVGHGATFATTFNNPWGVVEGTSLISEWVGVRADNATLIQDQVASGWSYPFDGGTHRFAIQGNARAMFVASDANIDAITIVAQNGAGQDLPGTATALQPGTSLNVFFPEAVCYAIRLPNHPGALNAAGSYSVGDLNTPGVGWSDRGCLGTSNELLKGTASGNYTVRLAAKNSNGDSECFVWLECWVYNKNWEQGMKQLDILLGPGEDKTLAGTCAANQNTIFWVRCVSSSGKCRITVIETKTP